MPSYLTPAILASLALLSAGWVAVIALSDGLAPVLRRRAVLVFGGVVAIWLPLLAWLAGTGVFLPGPGLPLLPVAALLPVLLFLLALSVSPWLRSVADGLDQRWLIALQGLRVMGWVFVALWLGGQIPWEFGIPAGLGDIAVGLLAVVALRAVLAGADPDRWAGRVNAAGLGDFVLAVGTGILTTPGPAYLLAPDLPNLVLNDWPLALIPAFGVPLFIVAHVLSIRLSLKRRRAGTVTAPA